MDLDGVILSAVSQTMTDTMWSHFYVEPKIEQTPTPEKKAKKTAAGTTTRTTQTHTKKGDLTCDYQKWRVGDGWENL